MQPKREFRTRQVGPHSGPSARSAQRDPGNQPRALGGISGASPWLVGTARSRRSPSSDALDDQFLKHYADLVARAEQWLGRDRQAAEDLVHDTYVRLALRHFDIRSVESIEGYLFITLRNVHLSQVRRRQSKVSATASIIDHESALVGLRSLVNEEERRNAYEALGHVVRYACDRKNTSKVASVLILRFFHGYYAGEIAQVVRATEATVAQRLRMARAEARAYLANPGNVRDFNDRLSSRRRRDLMAHDDAASIRALQHAIFDARTGPCFTDRAIERLYAGQVSDPLDVATLGHLVSCAACLDAANRRLGLPRLADRDPSDRLGRDPSNGSGSGRGAGDLTDVLRARVKGAREDHPYELQIAVNGLFVSAQAVNGSFNEHRLKILLSEPIVFVEILDEHGRCLLYLDVEPPPFGLVDQTVSVPLSGGRQLCATLAFADAAPTLHVIYDNPTADGVPERGLESGAEPTTDSNHAVIGRIPRTLIERLATRKEATRADERRRIWPLVERFSEKCSNRHRGSAQFSGSFLRNGPHGNQTYIPLVFRLVMAGIIVGLLLANPRQTLGAVDYARRAIVDSLTQLMEKIRPRPVLPSRPVTRSEHATPLAFPVVSVAPFVSSPPPTASHEVTDLELSETMVEALRVLDEVGALTEEQVSVERRADRRLHIEGIVDSDARRRVLTAALGALRKPRIRMNLVTLAEAAARPRTSPPHQTSPLRSAEVTRDREPAAYEPVRRYITVTSVDSVAGAASQVDGSVSEAVRRFSGDLLERSLQARIHGRTVRELVASVPAVDAGHLSSDGQATWRALVGRHVEALRRETAALRHTLDRVFSPGNAEEGPALPENHPPRDAWQLSERLDALASKHDLVVRRAFTVATDGRESMEVATPAFRRSLLATERLAEGLLATMPDVTSR